MMRRLQSLTQADHSQHGVQLSLTKTWSQTTVEGRDCRKQPHLLDHMLPATKERNCTKLPGTTLLQALNLQGMRGTR